MGEFRFTIYHRGYNPLPKEGGGVGGYYTPLPQIKQKIKNFPLLQIKKKIKKNFKNFLHIIILLTLLQITFILLTFAAFKYR